MGDKRLVKAYYSLPEGIKTANGILTADELLSLFRAWAEPDADEIKPADEVEIQGIEIMPRHGYSFQMGDGAARGGKVNIAFHDRDDARTYLGCFYVDPSLVRKVKHE